MIKSCKFSASASRKYLKTAKKIRDFYAQTYIYIYRYINMYTHERINKGEGWGENRFEQVKALNMKILHSKLSTVELVFDSFKNSP